MTPGIHYIYCLFRQTGFPCYIGKGKGLRVRDHFRRKATNPHLRRIIAAAGGELPAVILHSGLSEETAFAYERALIAAIGRGANGGPLVNLTDGGEGPAGRAVSDETRAKIGAKSHGRLHSAETRLAMREAHMGHPVKAETRQAISAAQRGRPKMRAVSRRQTAETRAKIAAAKRGRSNGPHSAETRAKIRASTRAYWAARVATGT